MSSFDLATELPKARALFQQGKHAKAKPLLLKILRHLPDHFEALQLLGYMAGAGNDYQSAAKYLSRAAHINPLSAESWYYQGVALQKLKQHEKAIASFAEALRLHPDLFEALHDTGLSLSQLMRFDEAVTYFDKALAVDRLAWKAYYNRGVALGNLKRYEEEIASYDQALAINPTDAGTLANRGVALGELGMNAEAVEWFQQALKMEPKNFVILSCLGTSLAGLARYDEAMDLQNQALKLKPDYPEAHFNRAILKLLRGDLENGWKEFEWRWKTAKFAPHRRISTRPPWTGKQPLRDKSILIYHEQGYGDTLQFCRYVPLLAELGAKVILEVQPPLKSLLSELPGAHQVIASGEPVPDYEFHCSLFSLPLAFNTQLETIPNPAKYIQAPAGLVSEWSKQLKHAGTKRIGIAWAGSRTNINDRNRSLPLEMLLPLVRLPITLVSLQKDLKAQDRAFLDAQPNILRFEEQLRDFSDTAALIESLDLVITVDTSVAHLAAAMGKPVWILLAYAPDFRWLLDRSDSPWYPTAKIFRQPEIGNWTAVISEVVQRMHREFL